MERIKMYTASDGTEIFVSRGVKGPLDFRVSYRHPRKEGERAPSYRTPKHAHVASEILIMRQHDNSLTQQLCDELYDIAKNTRAPNGFPPSFQMFDTKKAIPFAGLNKYSELPVDAILAITDLISIQEKIGKGEAVKRLFAHIKENTSRFRIMSAATWRNFKMK